MEADKIIIHAVVGNNNSLENVTFSSQTAYDFSCLQNEINRLKTIMNDMKEEKSNIAQNGEIYNIRGDFYKDGDAFKYKELIKIKDEEIKTLKEIISLLREELNHYKNNK